MKNLTIKLRIILWYSLLLLGLLGGFFLYMYFTMAHTLYADAASFLQMDAKRAVEGLKINAQNAVFDDDIDYDSATVIAVYSNDNHLLLGQPPKEFPAAAQPSFNQIFKDGLAQRQWLVCDLQVIREGKSIGWVRAMRPVEPVEHTLASLRMLIILAIPAFFIIAALGGLIIVRRAFTPLDRIIRTAEQIGQGDLSRRICLDGRRDEVGRLADTFDEMLSRLEESFNLEKQFTANASHELRTPTAVIMAQAEETLNGVKSTDEYRDSLETILIQSRNMSTIISKLLNLARGDEGRQKPDLEMIDLSILTAGVVEEMRTAAKDVGIAIRTQLEEGLTIYADQTMIAQLLINLIDNAIKYNHPGGYVKINLKREKSSIQLVIEDNGIGISKENLPKIWNRFYRAEKSRSGSGNGLGLAMVKWIVDVHGGKISTKSELGQGSRFEIRLPGD